MGVIETRTFKSGNSVAVRLPKELGVEAGVAVLIERVGQEIRLKSADHADEGTERMRRMLAALKAIGPVGEIERREPIEFPDRPGLY